MDAVVLDGSGMKRTLGRMAHEILESNQGADNLVVVGILRRGYPVAQRLAFMMTQIEGSPVLCGKLDVTHFRDDRADEGEDRSEIPFRVNDKSVILVDEVVFTGRTVRAAMESLLKFGRPSRIQLAVLIDRGHRELPIQPDFVGKTVETAFGDHIVVTMPEDDTEESVTLVHAQDREAART
ncbi:MAG: bifunctional pyr operon transcriptional regulator/uracil phosphoribosyltransferase PyrR [Chthonomonadaceae bacterium]|nr:bifunctional pyr operon transcriptional regulator/uracil phosphoribosyltransferase PyrR [Chthonomonadaceae bacterium]